MEYTDEMVEKVKLMYIAEYTLKEMSEELEIGVYHINKILKELNWK